MSCEKEHGSGVYLAGARAALPFALATFVKGGPLRRALEGQAVVDASWALASRGGGRFDREFMMGATLPQVVAWIGGTVIGVLSSDVVGDVERLGLDVIFP